MKVHNIIKILYSNMGYLPGYPYHLISDKEMFDAFLRSDGFFADQYPCPSEYLREPYDALLACITGKINAYLDDGTDIPNWVYSYMLMSTITYTSPEEDISYLCEMANIELPGILAEFDAEVADVCYNISTKWLKKQPSKYKDRVPTMFGEPHVIKSLRLDQANILLDTITEGT